MQKTFLDSASMIPEWTSSFFSAPSICKKQAAAAEADAEYYAGQAHEQMLDMTNAAQDMLAQAIETGSQTTQAILESFTGAFHSLQAPAAEIATDIAETTSEIATDLSDASKAAFEACCDIAEEAAGKVATITSEMMDETAIAMQEFDVAALTPSVLFEDDSETENSAAYTALMILPGVDLHMAKRLYQMGYKSPTAFSDFSETDWLNLEGELGLTIDRSAWTRYATTRTTTKHSVGTKEMRMPENLYATALEKRDDLTRLGLSDETVEVLFDLGVYEYRQITEWDDAEARWIRAVAKQYGAEFTNKNWRKEAAALA